MRVKQVSHFRIYFLFSIFLLTSSQAFALAKKKTSYFPPQDSVQFGDLEIMLSGSEDDLYQEIHKDSSELKQISAPFRSLGELFSNEGLIWSSPSATEMTQREARDYCQQLGASVRLPTLRDFDHIPEALKSKVGEKSVWTATYRPSRGYYFYSKKGTDPSYFDPPEARHFVICVLLEEMN